MGAIRGSQAEPPVAADGGGSTVFRGMKSLPPAPLLNFVVRAAEPAKRLAPGSQNSVHQPGAKEGRRHGRNPS